MNKQPLIEALEQKITEYKEQANAAPCNGVFPEADPDVTEMLLVLVRIVRKSEDRDLLHQVFGAPGDWGYGTPIGDALRKLYGC